MPLGVKEVAEMLGVERRTVHQWTFRGAMPPADFEVNGLPSWDVSTILQWAGLTGRLREEGLRAKYREVFGDEPKRPRRAGPEAGTEAARQRSVDAAATKAHQARPARSASARRAVKEANKASGKFPPAPRKKRLTSTTPAAAPKRRRT